MRVVVPEAPETFRIAIEFNRREAEALHRVTRCISGCPESTRRSVFDELRRLLVAAGVRDIEHLARGDINFKE